MAVFGKSITPIFAIDLRKNKVNHIRKIQSLLGMIYALIGLGRCFQSIRNEDSRPFEALLLQPPLTQCLKLKRNYLY
jgi:hypothetical protein